MQMQVFLQTIFFGRLANSIGRGVSENQSILIPISYDTLMGD